MNAPKRETLQQIMLEAAQLEYQRSLSTQDRFDVAKSYISLDKHHVYIVLNDGEKFGIDDVNDVVLRISSGVTPGSHVFFEVSAAVGLDISMHAAPNGREIPVSDDINDQFRTVFSPISGDNMRFSDYKEAETDGFKLAADLVKDMRNAMENNSSQAPAPR